MDCGRDFIYVLSPRTLGANGGQLKGAEGDGGTVRNL